MISKSLTGVASAQDTTGSLQSGLQSNVINKEAESSKVPLLPAHTLPGFVLRAVLSKHTGAPPTHSVLSGV